MPLLKGNPLLIEWFQQCFPCENMTVVPVKEYESLNFHKATETMEDTDVYEHIPQTEILPDPIDNPCHIRYINGRIYYGSRILLPAKLSFLVANARDQEEITNAAKPNTIDLTSPVHQTEETTNSYRCVHGIKQFGDIKLKEQQRIHFENELNFNGHGSTDDSDRTDDELSKSVNTRSDERNAFETLDTLQTHCCDDMTLKAHALRLNPNAHSSELIKSSDLLELLKPTDR